MLVQILRLVGCYDEWETFQIKDLFEIKNGLNKGKEFFGHGIPILNYMDVNQNISNDESSIEGLVDVDNSEIERYNVKPNDLFFTRTSETSDEIGLTSAYIGKEMDCVFSGFILRARPIKNNINSLFLAYHLRTKQNRNNIIKYSSITTRALISGSNLYQMKINLPSLKEQNKIADFLSNIDKKLNYLNQKINQIQEFKKYLLQNIFAQKLRFDFDDEWEKVELKDLAFIPKKNKISSVKGLKLLTVKLHTKGIELNDRIKPKLTKRGRPYYIRESGELLIGRQNFHNGGMGIVPESLDGGICSNAISSFKPIEDKTDINYLYYFLSRPEYYIKSERLIGGTGQKEFSEKELLKLKIDLPSLEEQEKIVKFFSNVDNKLDITQKQLSEMIEFKKGLLQQMLIFFMCNKILKKINSWCDYTV